jgi:ankyrin repeat protein
VQGIEESIPYRVVAFHQAGSPLPGDLLNYSCTKTDNVQIVDYLINQSPDIFQAMFDYSTNESPYRIAKKNKFHNVASYLKYRLSVECTKAIQAKQTEYVRKLVRAGASVDMHDTNNLQVALELGDAELIQILCENGVKMPIEWIQSKVILLPKNIAQTMDSDIVFRINRSLINRRLRLSAASGDLSTLIQCQHLGADINSENCHGSTALSCSIQHGNYFPIVHALVSRGATILQSDENESMSLITLAGKRHYTQITNYLSQEINTQFLMTILNNDIQSAEKLGKLGADFNYHDEQNRTALHYAVQYHGIELVSWLCLRGSSPAVADINGNYPITEATEKGIRSQF